MQNALNASVDATIARAVDHLERTQAERGSWPADYGGPMFLLPMYLALTYASKRLPSPDATKELLRYFFNVQRPDGSIGLHAESTSGSMFTSTLGYVALRLLGVGSDDARVSKLRGWIHANGTPLGAASWGKFTLCLLGLYDWRGIHPLLPELWLLPKDAPMHPGRLWCHARQVYLPMAWLYGMRSTVPNDALLSSLRRELYTQPYEDIAWKKQRDVVSPADDFRPAGVPLRAVNKGQDAYEKLPFKPLRKAALAECLAHIRYEDSVTNDIDIGPVNAVLNGFVHLFRGSDGAADFDRHFAAIQVYLWQGHDGLKFQGYNNSELWDLAFALQALDTAGAVDRPVTARAATFLEANQILEDVPEPEAHYRHPCKGGWPFSNRAHGWPITDCTAEGLKCALLLEGRVGPPISEARMRDSVALLLSWQNEDGGWATYEKQRAGTWLETLNPSQVFGDIMVDTSYVECTSACVQALVKARARFGHLAGVDDAISRGTHFLHTQQRADGSFEGSWAVCFTYGTWFGITGLLAGGLPPTHVAIRRACDFLVGKQRRDGAWAEHGDTCRTRAWIEGPTGHVAQTSWALSALVRAKDSRVDVQQRAAEFLTSKQDADGSWAREAMVGVFNRTCLISYDNYRNIFPLWALAEWRAANR